jgi:acyl carrier protein
LIYTKEGERPIENIKVDDIVYSYNIEKDKVELNKVANTLNRETQGIYEITAGKETINVTAEHPFYVIDKGWIKAKDLQVGNNLKSSDSKLVIEISYVKALSETVTVYNIEVDGNHNYFITGSTILVHNKNIKELKEKQVSETKKKHCQMNDEIFDKLKTFIIKEAAVEDEEVTRDAQIEDDLGVTGDDAVDFLIAYGKAFNVDVTKFMAADYFNGEGDIILPALIGAITGKRTSKNKILTVGHLEKGIIAGRLDEEIISS